MTPEEILRMSSGVDYAELYEAVGEWVCARENAAYIASGGVHGADDWDDAIDAADELRKAEDDLAVMYALIEADAVRNSRLIDGYYNDNTEYGLAPGRADGLGDRNGT